MIRVSRRRPVSAVSVFFRSIERIFFQILSYFFNRFWQELKEAIYFFLRVVDAEADADHARRFRCGATFVDHYFIIRDAQQTPYVGVRTEGASAGGNRSVCSGLPGRMRIRMRGILKCSATGRANDSLLQTFELISVSLRISMQPDERSNGLRSDSKTERKTDKKKDK